MRARLASLVLALMAALPAGAPAAPPPLPLTPPSPLSAGTSTLTLISDGIRGAPA